MAADTKPTIAELIATAYELFLSPTETVALIRHHRPGTSNDEILAGFQNRLDEIERERAIRDQWYEAEFGCAPPAVAELDADG